MVDWDESRREGGGGWDECMKEADTGGNEQAHLHHNPPTLLPSRHKNQAPHHRGASCWSGTNCNCGRSPEPHVLYGALVGGPGNNDDYSDDCGDYTKNEVRRWMDWVVDSVHA